MLATIALTITLANCCPLIKEHKSLGFSDQQIEEKARANGVPEWVIAWAKRHCRFP
jgi:hypothetical protein